MATGDRRYTSDKSAEKLGPGQECLDFSAAFATVTTDGGRPWGTHEVALSGRRDRRRRRGSFGSLPSCEIRLDRRRVGGALHPYRGVVLACRGRFPRAQ